VVECLCHGFESLGQNSNIPDAAGGFSQEDRFALMRFNQGNVAIGAGNGYGKTGKTGARSDVRDAKATGRKVGREE